MQRSRALNVFCVLSLVVVLTASLSAQVVRGARATDFNNPNERDLRPNGRGWGEGQAGAIADVNGAAGTGAPAPGSNTAGPDGSVANTIGTASNPAITYHGGPVMLGTTNVYFIWYGDWSRDAAAQNLLPEFMRSIGGSRWYNINTTYYNKSGQHVQNSVHFGGNAFNHSTYKNLGDADVQKIVFNEIRWGNLPKDSHGVYMVLTGPDVKEASGFCTRYCGWHTHALLDGMEIKYAFIGNPKTQCPASCEAQTTRSPNGDPSSDAMVSTMAHELSEAATDPLLNAWFDSNGAENADKCAWTFGTTYKTSNGSLANVKLGTRDWLIQQNWVRATTGYCALKF